MPARKKAKRITRREFLKKAGAAAGLGIAAAGCARPTASNRFTPQKAFDVKDLTLRERFYLASLSPKKGRKWLAKKRSEKKEPAKKPGKNWSLTQFLEKSTSKRRPNKPK